MTKDFGFFGEKRAALPPFSILPKKKNCHSEQREESDKMKLPATKHFVLKHKKFIIMPRPPSAGSETLEHGNF